MAKIKIESFIQELKNALYKDEAFVEALLKYRAKVRISSKSCNQHLAYDVIDRACMILSNVLTDIVDIDMKTMYLLNCDIHSYHNAEDVEIRCNFYESTVYRIGRRIQYCACVKQIWYLEKNNVIVYGNVVMDNYPAIYIEDTMKKDMQEMKKYLYIFRNVLFEIIKEIQLEMKFIKR